MSEPVAWARFDEDDDNRLCGVLDFENPPLYVTPLYLHPDPRVAELEYRLHKQAEVHAYEKEALQHQIKMLSDPIVRQKMLEPAPPIYIEADKFVDPRVAELEAVLRECREALDTCEWYSPGSCWLFDADRVEKAIAKIDEVLPK